MTTLDHADLMDRIYARQRHIYDATRAYFLLGRDRLIKSLRLQPGEAALEIGCGTGRNLIAAAKPYSESTFYGLDISTEMLRTAEAHIAKLGLASRIRLARADAADFAAGDLFGRPSFDAVFLSYSLSMIPRRSDVIVNALRCVKPGGRLHAVDFGKQERLPGFWRHLLYAWLDRFHVYPVADWVEIGRIIDEAGGAVIEQTSLYRGYAAYLTAAR